jgi:hypothetical protein
VASENAKAANGDLTKIIDPLCESMDGERIKIGTLCDSLGRKGFGPFLLIPALLVISPLGALPGACAVLGAFIFIASFQIFLGHKRPWLPDRMRKISFKGAKFRSSLKRMRPYAVKMEAYLENRLSVLARNEIVLRSTALVSMVLAVGIMTLSIIPFAPAALALPVLFFALGLSAHDGILIAIGYGSLAVIAVTIPFMFG